MSEETQETVTKFHRGFLKQRGTVFLEDGKICFPIEKFFERDLAYQFTYDIEKYVGDFKCEYYHLRREYLPAKSTRKNLRLFYTHAEPFVKPKASFLLIHGFGEHSTRYMDVLDYLAVNEYSVHMIDLSGFGLSGGAKGNSTMSEMHEDIELIMKEMNPELPLFIFGHSMGGGLVSTLMIRNPGLNIAGVVCSSALFGLPNDRNFPWLLKKIFKYSGPLFDDVVVNSYISGSSLSKNNYNIKKMIEDRLINPFLSLHYPLLVMHGKNDSVTSPHDSVRFYKHASSLDKTLKIIPHAYHEPMHDTEALEYKQNILEFLEERYSKAPKFGKLERELKKGFPSDTKKNIALLITFFVILSIVKRLQLFTHILPVRHIMMRIFKYH